jgi:hypothetical protein
MRSRDASGRDEALIEALATRGRLPAEHLTDELALVLAAWVGQLDAGLTRCPSFQCQPVQCPPAAAAASLPTRSGPATHSRNGGGRRSRRATRRVAVAAAVLAVVVAGGVAVAEKPRPGNPLWGLSRLVNPGRAASLEASQLADSSLRQAEDDLAHGRYTQAQQRLADARAWLAAVRGRDGRTDLADRVAALERRLARAQDGSAHAVPRQPGGVPTGGGVKPVKPTRPAPAPAPAHPPRTGPPAGGPAPHGSGPPSGAGEPPPTHGSGGGGQGGAAGSSTTSADTADTADGGTGRGSHARPVAGTGLYRAAPSRALAAAATSVPARQAASSGGSGRSCSTVSRETARVNAT